MIKITHKGDWKSITRFLTNASRKSYIPILQKYGEIGVEALRAATPKDTGTTAGSWFYSIKRDEGKLFLEFRNTNIVDGVPIAIIIQYGHATSNGGYVEGRDYINPALQPVFDKLADEVWKEVQSS